MLPLFVEARTIMVCSPRREIYKAWCLRPLSGPLHGGWVDILAFADVRRNGSRVEKSL